MQAYPSTIESAQDEELRQGPDGSLLKEIRERFRYASDAWKDVKDEAMKDMRYVCNDPWDPIDKMERADHGRPALALDQLGQYLNQAKNQIRQNPRGIKIDPVGEGANDDTAEFLQNLIRGIEYDSKAQRNAYAPAFECMLERGYGYFRITRKTVPGKDHQVIHIKGILNPDSVVYDPDYTEADWSDAMYCFVVDPIPWDAFKARWPKAKYRDFTPDMYQTAPDWIQDKAVMVGEYWKVTRAKDGERSVVQYMTNGVEIMEKNAEIGTHIPIIPVIGREKYITEAGKVKRKIFSMVRLARDPQMLACYLWSQMAEEAKLTPKVPFVGYKGQFESDKVAWDSVTSQPRPYLQADVLVDGANQGVLPLPTRPQFVPNFQAYLQALDGTNRAIQASMGLTPLPTAAARRNEKSGVALERIENQENIGVFDFTDKFDAALHLAGTIIVEWYPKVYPETDRMVGLAKPDGSREVVRNDVIDPEGDPLSDHGVTVDVGASYQSQKEAIAAFLDNLITSLPTLPVPPPAAAKLLALAIRARNLGPRGDQMADIVEGDPQGQMQQGVQAMQQVQQQGQLIQALQVELQKLQMEKMGKITEHKGKMDQITLQTSGDMLLEKMKLENALAIAEVSTKAQNINERMAAVEDMMKQFHDQAHDLGMQAQQQQHEQVLAQQAAQNQQQLTAQQGQQQQALQAQQQPQNGEQEQ